MNALGPGEVKVTKIQALKTGKSFDAAGL